MTKRPVDFTTAEAIKSPYALYAELRERDELAWLEENDQVDSDGKWLLFRHDDVKQLLQQNDGLSKEVAQFRTEQSRSPFDQSMLSRDQPDHTRLRRIANKAFTPSRIAQLGSYIDETATELIADIKRQDAEVDFMQAFAGPFPVIVIAKLLGVPRTDFVMFRDWTIALSFGFDSANHNPEQISRKVEAMKEMRSYFEVLIDDRRKAPGDDLISQFIHLHDEQGKLNAEEVLGMCMVILFAGNDTTVSLMGNGLYCLLKNPDQFRKLISNPSLAESAVEEVLRYESPAQRTTFRVCTKEVTIGRHTIPKGEQVCGVIGAANRDPKHFENPDLFNIERSPNPHLSFGLGIHVCLGSILARREGVCAYTKFAQLMPNVQLARDPGEIEWNQNTFIRGIKSLPVKLA